MFFQFLICCIVYFLLHSYEHMIKLHCTKRNQMWEKYSIVDYFQSFFRSSGFLFIWFSGFGLIIEVWCTSLDNFGKNQNFLQRNGMTANPKMKIKHWISDGWVRTKTRKRDFGFFVGFRLICWQNFDGLGLGLRSNTKGLELSPLKDYC